MEEQLKKHPLLRSDPMFKVYLGGGMGVRMYLESINAHVPKKVAQTKDFDFTFAVPRPLKESEVPAYSLAMYTYMYNYLKRFTRMDALKVKSYTRKSFIPATGKRTYHVIEFGDNFVDCTLAYVPGARRLLLRNKGVAVSAHVYQDVLSVLAGSFVYKKIKSRNPLTGKRMDKGLKNLARLKALRKARSPKTVRTDRFISAIQKGDESVAERRARSILKSIY